MSSVNLAFPRGLLFDKALNKRNLAVMEPGLHTWITMYLNFNDRLAQLIISNLATGILT